MGYSQAFACYRYVIHCSRAECPVQSQWPIAAFHQYVPRWWAWNNSFSGLHGEKVRHGILEHGLVEFKYYWSVLVTFAKSFATGNTYVTAASVLLFATFAFHPLASALFTTRLVLITLTGKLQCRPLRHYMAYRLYLAPGVSVEDRVGPANITTSLDASCTLLFLWSSHTLTRYYYPTVLHDAAEFASVQVIYNKPSALPLFSTEDGYVVPSLQVSYLSSLWNAD